MKFRKLLATIMVFSMVFGLFGTAFAADNGSVDDGIIELLTSLGLVRGDDRGLRLDDTITRAEMMTILVRGFGQEDTAALLAGAPAFSDTADHWASGYIALAKNRGLTTGYPDGTFKPQANVTGAEALTMVARLVGLDVDDSVGWPDNYLNAAIEAGIVGADSPLVAAAGAAAIRGDVFTSFGVAGTSVPVTADGKNLFAAYVKIEPPTLTVDEVDPVTTADSITLSGSVDGAAMLLVGDGLVDFAADGSWSADVDLQVGANDIWVTALDVVGNEAAQVVKVERIPGEATGIRIDGPAQVTAGSTAEFVVAVHDANDAAIAGAEFEVDEVTGGAFDAATGIFTASETAGAASIAVSSGDFTASVVFNVVAGEMVGLKVTPATASLGVGQTLTFAAAGADAYGNEIPLTDAVQWAASAGVIDAQGNFAPTTSGDVTVTATAAGMSGKAEISVYGAATKVVLETPAALVANGQDETTLVAKVVDANNNVVGNYDGTITFASSNGGAATIGTATVQAVNGVAQTTLKSAASGAAASTVLSATATGLQGALLNYSTTAQSVSRVEVVAQPSVLAEGATSQGNVRLRLLDQTGQPMITAPGGANQVRVRLEITGSVVRFGALSSVDVTMNAVTVNQVLNATSQVGSATITGSLLAPSGASITVDSVSVTTQTVGTAHQMALNEIAETKSGTAREITFRVLDYNGNQLTNPSGSLAGVITVKLTQPNGTVTTLSAAESTTLGTGTYTIAGNQLAATGTYTVTVESANMVSASQSLVVTPGDAAKVSLTATPATIAATGTATSTLKVEIQDANNNKVTTGSYEVTITKSVNNNATGSFPETKVITSGGEATVTVTGTTAHGVADTFTATATGLAGDTATVTTVIMGTANNMAFGAIAAITAGGEATVPVQVRDGNNNVLTYDQGRAVTVTVKDGNTVVGSYSGTTVNGVASVKVPGLTAAKNYTVEAESAGLTKITGAGALTVNPGSASQLTISADRSSLSANLGSRATITVRSQDQYGNNANVTANTTVYLKATSGAPTYGDFEGGKVVGGDWDGWVNLTINAGTNSASTTDTTNSFRASSASGSVVIEARSASLSSASLTLSSHTAGALNTLQLVSGDAAQASPAGTDHLQTVTVKLVDSAGNVATHVHNDAGANVQLTVAGDVGTLGLYTRDAAGTWNAYVQGNDAQIIKGEITFGIRYSSTVETLTLTFTPSGATLTGAGVTTARDTTAKFTPGAAVGVVVDNANPRYIQANGVAVTQVSARVVDGLGNTVTTAGGTMDFSIAFGADYASLQQASAPISNGVATVVVQSKAVPATSWVQIKAESDVTGNGTKETHTNNQAVNVDGVAPNIASITMADGGGTGGTIEVADTVTIVFDEAINPASIHASLTAGGPAQAIAVGNTGSIVASGAGNTVTIVGIATLESSAVSADTAAAVNATLSADGLTLVLTITSVTTGGVTVNGDINTNNATKITTAVRDLAGNNLSAGTVPAGSINGNF